MCRIWKRISGSECQQVEAIICGMDLDTYIIDAQQTIAGLDATRFIDGAMKSHVCYDQRIIGTAPQR